MLALYQGSPLDPPRRVLESGPFSACVNPLLMALGSRLAARGECKSLETGRQVWPENSTLNWGR